MVRLEMPEPACRPRAARAARAQPNTREPPACHAARAASRAKVLPEPGSPTTTSMWSPLVVIRRTIATCSSASDGRAPRASSTLL